MESTNSASEKNVSEENIIPTKSLIVTRTTGQNMEDLFPDATKVIGLSYLEEAQMMSMEEIEEAHSKIRLKVDLHIMPLICFTYMLQFLDKQSLNYAAAYSFREDLGLEGQRYSWVAAIFNFGYLFWSLPSNYIIQRVPIAKQTGVMLFCWAIMLIAHIGAKNYGGILVLRFILGMFEASIAPSCMALCSVFYTKKEQPFRMCTFLSCNGISTMVGGLLAYGLGHATHSALKPWKLIFLLIGLINFVWSFIFFFFCPDSPTNARFLSPREKAILVERISRNNQGIKEVTFKKSQVMEAVKDYKTYIYLLLGLGLGVMNGGVSNFQSALIKGFGFSGIQTTILQLPNGALELVVIFATGVVAITFKNLRCYLWFVTCLPGFAGLIGIRTIPLEHRWALVACTWLQGIGGAPIILTWVLLAANVAGHTKRAVTNGAYFTMYATGNIIGPNIFFSYQAPRYVSGIIGITISYGCAMIIILIYRFCLVHENRLRDQECGGYTEEVAEQAALDGFKDMTDGENRGFRYVY